MDLETESSDSIISSSKGTPRRSNVVVSVEQLSVNNQIDYTRLRAYFTEELLQEHVVPIIQQKSPMSVSYTHLTLPTKRIV